MCDWCQIARRCRERAPLKDQRGLGADGGPREGIDRNQRINTAMEFAGEGWVAPWLWLIC